MISHKKTSKRVFPVIFLCLLTVVLSGLAGGCSSEREYYTSLSQLQDKKIGYETGTAFYEQLEESLPDAESVYYNSYTDQAIDVKNGKIDGYITDEPLARDMINEVGGLAILDEYLGDCEYAFVFAKTEKGNLLREQYNEFLAKLKEDGTLQQIDSVWFGTDESLKSVDIPTEGENGTLTLATNSNSKPFSYIKNNKNAGYDIDIAARFCREYGYGLKITDTSMDTVVTNVVSGLADFAAGCITVTEERKEIVDFGDPDYVGGVVIVVAAETEDDGAGFFASIKESFEKTFIRENRWQMILSGIGVTLIISVGSAVAGTLLGFGICMMKRSRHKAVSVVATVYIRIIQGLPVMVVLMLLYYVVFATSGINAIAVAIIGFSLNFAAYVSEMMRTGIEAVDAGQAEAARALGFSRAKTFGKVILPQAATHFLPVYTGEFISLVKMTSVVGYITIQDLTKVGDIIRSATYEAFFPLIAVALIYFVLSYALTFLLNIFTGKLLPNRKNRKIKGVKI